MQALMAVCSQAVMMIPWPSPGEEQSEEEETERRSVGEQVWPKRETEAQTVRNKKRREGGEPEEEQSAARGEKRGETRRGKTRENITADCELHC